MVKKRIRANRDYNLNFGGTKRISFTEGDIKTVDFPSEQVFNDIMAFGGETPIFSEVTNKNIPVKGKQPKPTPPQQTVETDEPETVETGEPETVDESKEVDNTDAIRFALEQYKVGKLEKTLNSRKKQASVDLAAVLKLKTTGTKNAVIERILNFCSENLKEDSEVEEDIQTEDIDSLSNDNNSDDEVMCDECDCVMVKLENGTHKCPVCNEEKT